MEFVFVLVGLGGRGGGEECYCFAVVNHDSNRRYANEDVYEGYFEDNLPHGHGTLKRGHFLTSAAHVYFGQWECGQKHGYGVMDDIVAGINKEN